MKYLAIAIIVAAALICDLVANVKKADEAGWDVTALLVLIWAFFQWRSR